MLGRVLRYLYFAFGIGILLLVLIDVDFGAVFDSLERFGWLGFSLVLGIYLIAFWVDSLSWLLAIKTAPISWLWSWRAFSTRIAGEAYNALIPAAGIGGEPIKADILKRRFGVHLKLGSASLIIAKTVNMIALIAFLGLGFTMVQGMEILTYSIKTMALTGLTILIVGTAAIFLFQRYKLTSRLAYSLSNSNSPDWFRRSLVHLEDIDRIFIDFYKNNGRRFKWALFLAFSNWLLGAAEIYLILNFLGYSIDWTEAWVIEAATQLTRTAAFFIPAAIGVQEGTFVFICGLLTGNPTLGIATALIRRAREILWIGAGVIFAFVLSSDR